MNAARMVAWETCVQSDCRVWRRGAEIVGAGEDVGFARMTVLGRPRDRCCSCFLGTSSHFHQSITPFCYGGFSSRPISDVPTCFHDGITLPRPHRIPRLPTLIISIAPKTSRPGPHSSQRTHSPPLRSRKRTQHNRIHRVRNPRSLLPLRNLRKTALPPLPIPPPRPHRPRRSPFPVRSKRPSRSSRP